VSGGLPGVLFRLWAGGGADLAAASASPAIVTISALAAGAAPYSTTKLALLPPPSGGGELVLAPLGVWPRPAACVGVVAGSGGGCGVRCAGCGRAASPIWPRRRRPPPPSPCRRRPLASRRFPSPGWCRVGLGRQGRHGVANV